MSEMTDTQWKVCRIIAIVICSAVFLYYSYGIIAGEYTFKTRTFHASDTVSGSSFSRGGLYNLAGVLYYTLMFGGLGSSLIIFLYLELISPIYNRFKRKGGNDNVNFKEDIL